MTRSQALSNAAIRLSDAGVETPDLDARLLLLAVENISSAALIDDPDTPLTASEAYDSVIERRCKREPVSKILGYRDFWTHCFIVTPDVLDPRPDTETLIEAALAQPQRSDAPRILDLGTGSGCILLTLLSELPNATGLGVDQSKAALKVAKSNAEMLKLSPRAEFIAGNWSESLDETFDLVVCNPPYISTTESETLSPDVTLWDPEAALFAGMDGLQAYREIASGLATVLKTDGTAFFEIGVGQADAVTMLFEAAGFTRLSSHKDLGGHVRCLVFQHRT